MEIRVGARKHEKKKRQRTVADEVPDFLPLGPQRYGDPHFWGPAVNGPLLEDANYQRALRAVGDLDLPSDSFGPSD